MTFEYNPRSFTKDYAYNESIFRFDPTISVPVPPEHEDSGKTLAEIYEMTDAEAASIILEEKWCQVRQYRDKELVRTDWTAGTDVPTSIKEAYGTYRQTLRDITTTYQSPDDIVWPEKPL